VNELIEMEARINELASKRRTVGLLAKEEREYAAIIAWQVSNKYFCHWPQGGRITFEKLEDVVERGMDRAMERVFGAEAA